MGGAPILQVPFARSSAAVVGQPGAPAANPFLKTAADVVGSLLRLIRNQRLDIARHGALEAVRTLQISNNSLPEPDCLVYRNNTSHAQILRAKFERTGGGIPPGGDNLLVLLPRYQLGDPAAVRRPLAGWPLDHMHDVTLIVRPSSAVYAYMSMAGPTGWLYFSVLDPDDPYLVR